MADVTAPVPLAVLPTARGSYVRWSMITLLVCAVAYLLQGVLLDGVARTYFGETRLPYGELVAYEKLNLRTVTAYLLYCPHQFDPAAHVWLTEHRNHLGEDPPEGLHFRDAERDQYKYWREHRCLMRESDVLHLNPHYDDTYVQIAMRMPAAVAAFYSEHGVAAANELLEGTGRHLFRDMYNRTLIRVYAMDTGEVQTLPPLPPLSSIASIGEHANTSIKAAMATDTAPRLKARFVALGDILALAEDVRREARRLANGAGVLAPCVCPAHFGLLGTNMVLATASETTCPPSRVRRRASEPYRALLQFRRDPGAVLEALQARQVAEVPYSEALTPVLARVTWALLKGVGANRSFELIVPNAFGGYESGALLDGQVFADMDRLYSHVHDQRVVAGQFAGMQYHPRLTLAYPIGAVHEAAHVHCRDERTLTTCHYFCSHMEHELRHHGASEIITP